MPTGNEGSFRNHPTRLLAGGDAEHQAATAKTYGAILDRIVRALDLLFFALERAADCEVSPPAPNSTAALACLSSAFRGIRAATLLAVQGYSTEARTIVRRTYETAALARMLAKDAHLAERWFEKGEWFPDRKVRQWFGVQSQPGDEHSSYQDFYREASAYAHPTVKSTVPLIVADGRLSRMSLDTKPEPGEALVVLREIAAEALFVCLAARNALASPDSLGPDWTKSLEELATDIGVDLPNLRTNYDSAAAKYERFVAQIMPASEVDRYLQEHPNGYDNTKRRADSTADAGDRPERSEDGSTGGAGALTE